VSCLRRANSHKMACCASPMPWRRSEKPQRKDDWSHRGEQCPRRADIFDGDNQALINKQGRVASTAETWAYLGLVLGVG
jgi:hypothetical protein